MTARDDIRLLPSAALTVTAVALLAFVVQYHRAAMWACVVALVLAVAALFTVAIEAGREKARADDAERRAGDLAAKLATAEVEARIANDLLARYKADARVVIPIRRQSPIPDARKSGGMVDRFPTQRTGHEPWPPVARAIEAETTPIHDDTAVDMFMRSVDRWGEEADRDA
jgi:hypothetical protein